MFGEFLKDTRKPSEKQGAMSFLPYVVAAWLFIVGLYGIVTSRNLIHMTVCLAVVQSSTYVLLLSIGYRGRRRAADLRRTCRRARRPSIRWCRR